MVNLKTEKSFKDKRSREIPKEDWVIFKDKHESIVDADTWQNANNIRQKKRRNKADSLGEPHPLTGLMHCFTCKSKMYHNRGIIKTTGHEKNYYTCGKSKHGKEFCTDHRIKGDVVETLVPDTLKKISRYATTNEEDFTRQVSELFSSQKADTAKVGRIKLKASQARYGELDKLIQRIYEDMVGNRITDKRFAVLSNQYEREQSELEHTIKKLQADLDSFDDSEDRAAKFLELVQKHRDFSELTPTMILEFVDRIEVHERADRRCKITTQKVDVFLNFIGTYFPPSDAVEREPELRTDEEYKKYLQKLAYMREYKERRKANGGKPLGYFTGPKPDDRTPEESAIAEAEKTQRRKEYHAKWYQDNKERLKAEKAAKKLNQSIAV